MAEESQQTEPAKPSRRERTGAFIHRWQAITCSIIAFIGVVIGWQYTRDQRDSAVVQASTALKALERADAERRPYLTITSKDDGPMMSTDSRIIWNWEVKNIGKIAATNVRYESFIKVGSGTLQASSINPDGNFGTIPAGFDLWQTTHTSPGQRPTEFQKLVREDLGIQVAVRLTYSDQTGATYKSTDCLNIRGNGVVGRSCPDGFH